MPKDFQRIFQEIEFFRESRKYHFSIIWQLGNKCDQCDYACNQQGNLKIHKRTCKFSAKKSDEKNEQQSTVEMN